MISPPGSPIIDHSPGVGRFIKETLPAVAGQIGCVILSISGEETIGDTVIVMLAEVAVAQAELDTIA